MCNTTQVAMKKRSRTGASTVETVTKRAKQIALDDEVATPRQPTSPVDVTADFDEAGVTSESSVDLEEDLEPCKTIVSPDLNLEVRLMQGAVHEMQATVDLAAARISELRALLMQYAESR